MKILVVHNYYQTKAPSGENSVVMAEIKLLRALGHEVKEFKKKSDDISWKSPQNFMHAAIGPIFSIKIWQEVRKVINQFSPDVIHVHNVMPLIGPALVLQAARSKVPIVQTLHNYRLTCVAGTHFRDGQNCFLCTSQGKLQSIRHKCYRNSAFQTLIMAISQRIQRWMLNRVQIFLVLTPFMRNYLETLGVPSEKIVERPTWAFNTSSEIIKGNFLLFVGRLDSLKGIDALMTAWRSLDSSYRYKLVIVGSGPMQTIVESFAKENSNVEFLGQMKQDEITPLYQSAQALVLPSWGLEGLPVVVVEAASNKTPVIAFKGSSAATALNDDIAWLVEPNGLALAETLSSLDPIELASKQTKAKEHFDRHWSQDSAEKSLISVYQGLINRKQ
jgi:glycosyltransferase involved in cell wall biosynthesis